jgi:segregation and condensation protein B
MELKFVLEAILFSSQQPLTGKELKELLARTADHQEDAEAKLFKKVSLRAIEEALDTLAREHEQTQRSFRLVCIADSWHFTSQPEYAPWIRELVGQRPRPTKLSQPGMETLAIIAYRQPLTRAEIEQVRGVAVDGVLQTLLERGLVEQVGRADLPGRPITYGTTALFLEHFGLRGLADLPAADELRRVVIQRPEGPLTADPGLATAPPEELNLAPSSAELEPAGSSSSADSSHQPESR